MHRKNQSHGQNYTDEKPITPKLCVKGELLPSITTRKLFSTAGGLKKDWPVVALGEVVKFNPRFGKDELDPASLASFVPMKCVEAESGRFESVGDKPVQELSKGYTAFRDGDVIFAKVTPCMENGKAAVVTNLTNGVGFGSTEFFTLRPSEKLEAKYLLHFILQSSFRQNAASNMTGAVGLRRVPKSYLEQQLIPLPPLSKQKQIVAEIEKQFTRLDAGVAALRRVQANLKRYRASVLKAACEGKLVPTEVELCKAKTKKSDATSPTFESGEELLRRILDERRKSWKGKGKYKEPEGPDVLSLPKLPRGWVWAGLEQLLSSIRNGISLKPDREEGLAILRISAVRPMLVNADDCRYLAFIDTDYSNYDLKEGDLLFTRYNGNPQYVGVCGVVPPLARRLVYPDKLIRCRIASREVSPDFVAMMVNTGPTRNYLSKRVRTTAGQSGISGTDLKGLPIPMPAAMEQSRIVNEVSRRLTIVFQLESKVTTNEKRAYNLKQSILRRAFAGAYVTE